ncbi:MAG: CDP-diacylglycerol--serine O-phosphatidyltransferase [Beijerinckiaceae bacterium]|nr:CDP-diacylglycerol--serine O-phosphatidyltransferase [Beijerinckiaceae bacterium]
MTDLFPPFEPGDEPKPRRFKPVPFRILLPNFVTLLSLGSGFTAMRMAAEERFETAVGFILLAAILDGLDGRIARLLKGTSRFGAELDSLADFLSFGVAPAFILYQFGLKDLKSFGWLVAMLFAIAAALRLARFNVMIDDPTRPEWKKNFFVGMPAPAGAIVALLPVYLFLLGTMRPMGAGGLEALYVLFVAFMMVSRIPTYAGKTLGSRVPREWVIPLFGGVVFIAGLLATYTLEMLAIISVAYLALIPFGVQNYRKRERDDRRVAAQTTATPHS